MCVATRRLYTSIEASRPLSHSPVQPLVDKTHLNDHIIPINQGTSATKPGQITLTMPGIWALPTAQRLTLHAPTIALRSPRRGGAADLRRGNSPADGAPNPAEPSDTLPNECRCGPAAQKWNHLLDRT